MVAAALIEGSLIDAQVITDLGSVVTSVTGWITGNQILTFFLTCSLIGIGVGVFARLKRIV